MVISEGRKTEKQQICPKKILLFSEVGKKEGIIIMKKKIRNEANNEGKKRILSIEFWFNYRRTENRHLISVRRFSETEFRISE